ncbi:MAG: RNA pseudouridine synthase [Chitinophagales bacterium]|nr:RNA pseudouridine synthase [Chitinophagales bacterium]MDW8273012.1 RNA pseudouridine synthase [Chitinophagales bacterium]
MESIHYPQKIFKLDDVEVLYEDNHFIIVNKPPCILVQPDKSGNQNMEELVKLWLKHNYQKPGNVFLGVPHRLDKPVSGVLVLCKTSKSLKRFNEMLRNREVEKVYWAVVEKKPEPLQGTLTHWLRKSLLGNYSKAFNQEVPNSLLSELSYIYLCSSEYYHLVEVYPKTGRHHQIRVQLSTIGCPIKGDEKYGAKRQNRNGSIHLHARKISFIHPVNKNQIIVEANPDLSDKVWADVFNKCLSLEKNTN